MDIQTVIQAWQLLGAHKWLPLAILLVSWFTELSKDSTNFPIVNIPVRYQPLVPVGLSLLYGVLTSVQSGLAWPTVLQHAVLAAGGAMVLYNVIIKVAFNGNPPAWLNALVGGRKVKPAPVAPLPENDVNKPAN